MKDVVRKYVRKGAPVIHKIQMNICLFFVSQHKQAQNIKLYNKYIVHALNLNYEKKNNGETLEWG